MILDNEPQRKILLEMANNVTIKGLAARELVKLMDAIEHASIVPKGKDKGNNKKEK